MSRPKGMSKEEWGRICEAEIRRLFDLPEPENGGPVDMRTETWSRVLERRLEKIMEMNDPPAVLRAALTPLQRDRLVHCERIIEKGLTTFVEVGRALLEVRDSGLYLDLFDTFEEYCQERWGMSRIRAHQLIDATQVTENVLTVVNTAPANEAQARPLARLEPEEQREVWSRAVETSPNGQPTASHVKTTADEMYPKHKPLEGQGKLFPENSTRRKERPLMPGLDGPAFLPEEDEVRPFDNAEKFVEDFVNQVIWIREHGGIRGYSQGWTTQQLIFLRENLRSMKDQFSTWVSELEELSS